jgi:hypothetical protein
MTTKKQINEVIRSNFLNDFLSMDKENAIIFNSKFDQPTYLTFTFEFLSSLIPAGTTKQFNSNGVISDWSDDTDFLPQSLLITPEKFNNYSILTDGKPNSNLNYSTYSYLKDNLGDLYRANLLQKFIAGIEDLQKTYPYYITDIDGINELLKINPGRGSRLGNDAIITLKFMEGIDMRITSLINMYRTIVWDSVYQRWVLPDIMRYFQFKITISEVRLFNESVQKTFYKDRVINTSLPSINIIGNYCEFNIDDMESHINALKSYNTSEMVNPTIKIKVGNLYEEHVYPTIASVDSSVGKNAGVGPIVISEELSGYESDYNKIKRTAKQTANVNSAIFNRTNINNPANFYDAIDTSVVLPDELDVIEFVDNGGKDSVIDNSLFDKIKMDVSSNTVIKNPMADLRLNEPSSAIGKTIQATAEQHTIDLLNRALLAGYDSILSYYVPMIQERNISFIYNTFNSSPDSSIPDSSIQSSYDEDSLIKEPDVDYNQLLTYLKSINQDNANEESVKLASRLITLINTERESSTKRKIVL